MGSKKKREKKKKKQKHYNSLKNAYCRKYPVLSVKSGYADVELTEAVSNACKEMDFRQFPQELREMFSDHKRTLPNRFISKYKNMDEECNFDFQSIANEQYCHVAPYIVAENIILTCLYEMLKENGVWQRFMPVHHIVVRSYKGDFVVFVDGFHCHRSPYGKGYYTEKQKYIKIPNGQDIRQHQIALSVHALERAYERGMKRVTENKVQGALRPALLYQFANCMDFVPKNMGGNWYVGVYETYTQGPEVPNSLAHKIAYELLDRMKNFKILYGYCPIGFCEDDFVHLKTFLSPGMRDTPEFALIESIQDEQTRRKFKNLIERNDFTEDHIELYKFLQNNAFHVAEYI